MNKRILIIEDEVTIAELEKDYFEIEGYEADIAGTGLKGLELIQKNHYDLVILDLMLPGMNGFEVCKKIRENFTLPILMVSAKKEDIDKIRGLGLGADDFITKPFSPGELVARVKAHLAMYDRLVAVSAPKREISIRNLKIMPESRRVYLNEKEINLTATEYDLLLFLAENPDRVYSKEMLLDKIWGLDYFGDGATVTVHIGKLRDKIDKPNSKRFPAFFETVWGAGYRFNL